MTKTNQGDEHFEKFKQKEKKGKHKRKVRKQQRIAGMHQRRDKRFPT